MPSRKKQIYLDIQEIFKSIKDSKGIMIFKYFNIWDNQIDEAILGKTYSFMTPAVFIEVNTGEGNTLGGGYTSYPKCEITLHIVDNFLNSDETLEQNLEVFDLRDISKSKLNRKTLSSCSALMNILDMEDFKHDNIYKYRLGFLTNFIDDKGSLYDTDADDSLTFDTLVNPTINISVQYGS